MAVDEHTIELAGQPVHFLSAGATAPSATALLLHGLPDGAASMRSLLEQTGGVAVDLPGFGRSGKAGHLDYSLTGHAGFLERFLGLGAPELPAQEPLTLVGHGWGAAVAIVFAQRHPARVRRLVLLDPVAPVAGFRWPRASRALRRPLLGELLVGATTRGLLGRWLRSGAADPARAWPAGEVRRVWEDFDQGTQRALLRIHRATSPQVLADVGRELDRVTAPALILHGELDPWIERSAAQALAAGLPRASFEPVAGAGHWPWRDSTEVAERVAAFLR